MLFRLCTLRQHAFKPVLCRSKASLSTLRKVNDNIEELNFTEYMHGKDENNFKKVHLVSPNDFQSYFFNKLKLKFVKTETDDNKLGGGVELLRNVAANYDYWIVRNNQTHLLYYRVDMMIQRLKFLSSVGLTAREKLKHLQKYPPVLLFSFTNSTYNAKLVYLRGLIPKGEKDKYTHFFYPVTDEIALSRSDIQQRIQTVEKYLQLPNASAIRELLNIPCFFIEPSMLTIDHMFLHKFSMPFKFSVDEFTSHVLPPVCNLPELGLTPSKHFSNKATNDLLSELPLYSLGQILTYNYPRHNGVGTPECLSKFLVKAELEEKKDRTGGQPVKGRRGFNVPPRQY